MGVGRVMDDVSQKMQRKALKKNEDPLKILVNCTHDTFGVYDQKWVSTTTAFRAFGLLQFASLPEHAGCSPDLPIFG